MKKMKTIWGLLSLVTKKSLTKLFQALLWILSFSAFKHEEKTIKKQNLIDVGCLLIFDAILIASLLSWRNYFVNYHLLPLLITALVGFLISVGIIAFWGRFRRAFRDYQRVTGMNKVYLLVFYSGFQALFLLFVIFYALPQTIGGYAAIWSAVAGFVLTYWPYLLTALFLATILRFREIIYLIFTSVKTPDKFQHLWNDYNNQTKVRGKILSRKVTKSQDLLFVGLVLADLSPNYKNMHDETCRRFCYLLTISQNSDDVKNKLRPFFLDENGAYNWITKNLLNRLAELMKTNREHLMLHTLMLNTLLDFLGESNQPYVAELDGFLKLQLHINHPVFRLHLSRYKEAQKNKLEQQESRQAAEAARLHDMRLRIKSGDLTGLAQLMSVYDTMQLFWKAEQESCLQALKLLSAPEDMAKKMASFFHFSEIKQTAVWYRSLDNLVQMAAIAYHKTNDDNTLEIICLASHNIIGHMETYLGCVNNESLETLISNKKNCLEAVLN